MSEQKRNIELNNGWILCPSKSFPGKFYYFNVLNGETAWSLNQADNKDIKKENSIHKIADKSHGYPEPTMLPDETSMSNNNFSNIIKPNFHHNIPTTQQLPMFGQATFPKYVANVEPLIPNIVWTSVPFPMFCPDTRKPMLDKVTQISEFERELFSQSSNIPLCKRFKNYEKPILSFDRKNKIVKPLSKFETSTPKNSFLECVTESESCFPKPWIKEPALKLVPQLPDPKIPVVIKSNEKPIIYLSSKVENTKSSTEVPKNAEKDQVTGGLDSTDLRFLLLAKRKSVDATDMAVERKKPKPSEIKPLTLKKKVTFMLKGETDVDTDNDATTQEDFNPLTINLTQTTIQAPKSPVALKDKNPLSFMKVSCETPKTPPVNVKDQQPTYQQQTYQQPTYQQPNSQQPTFKNSTWYIVVDTDVLLLDYEFIDKIVLSDPKCRLVIPHAVAADIEALCLGDCRGQQRVINARQLTRKLATPPPHYIVEARPLENSNMVVTTESILHCCMKAVNKNYYVVLITNDPHLRIKANFQNIPSYKLNELKYGVDIRPNFTSEQKNIKMNTLNDDSDEKNQINQNISLLSNLKIIPEMTSDKKPLRMTSRDDVDGKNQCNDNFSWYRKSPVKKEMFLSSDSDTDSSLDCNKLINLTKPKSLKNINQSDSDGTSDISSEVLSLKLNAKNVLKTPIVPRNPFPPQNVKENGYVNFDKRILNPNIGFNTYSFGNSIPNEKPALKTNNAIHNFQKDFLECNFENPERLFCSIPITNLSNKQFKSKSTLENSVQPEMPNTCLSLRQEPFGATRENKILNPSQTRIKKIINTINNDCTTKTQLDSQINQTKDSTGIFKIPQLLPIKNGTRNTSVHVGNSTVNDKIGINIDAIDKNLIRFRIKSRSMREKLNTRIDEWICSYMQIMEDALFHILQKNSVCMKNTAAPLTLRDTLNCIKMLFDSHTKVRDFVNKLTQLLEKSMICVQGKLKMSIVPEDFMKLFGYSVLLVLNLKNILPQNEELKEAELRLNALQNTLESNAKELDPELVKSPSVNRSEVDKDQEEIRPPFFKKTSYVIDYLKKHFKEWSAYKEDIDNHNNHKIENHTDFKVVRTLGKNLNLLKINRKKTMSLTNKTLEDDSANRSKDAPRLIRLLENNQLIKPNKIESLETIAKHETTTKLKGLSNKKNNQNDFDFISEENGVITDQNKDVPLKKVIENIEQEMDNDSKLTEELNYTSHENTFLGNSETVGPKIIRNIKLIKEFENKFKDREYLDLDTLDYSEIYEPSVDKNLEFDIISEKNKKSEENSKNNNFEDNNYGLENTICTLEDFYVTPSISPDSKSNKNIFDSENTENSTSKNITSHYFNSISENNDTNIHIEEKTEINNDEAESDTYTENLESHNDSCIGNDNSETHIDNSGTHFDNSETHNDNYPKTAQSVIDDSTNDSGFENDSTYAHSLVKIFLNELSSTFKVIHTFVTKFVKEIRETELSYKRRKLLYTQASKSLEDMVAIIHKLKFIVKRESAKDTILKILLRHAGVEATTDKRMTRYRQLVIKCLEQARILESALKIIVSTTKGDFKALSTNTVTMNPSIRYFNIFE